MNYYERLNEYSVKNYFVFNDKNKTIDIFGPLVSQWHQKLLVILDMLSEGDRLGLQNDYDILKIRVVGVDPDSEVLRILKDNLSLCNKLIAEEKGESKLWLDMKNQSLEKKYFLDITIEAIKPPKYHVQKQVKNNAKGKSRSIQVGTDNQQSV